jgi:hypothetical protein
MDKRTLVGADVAAGPAVIEGLEQRGISVDVAAWVQDDDSGAWQLLISSPIAEKSDPRHIYREILAILHDLKASDFELDDVLVAGPNENLVKDLKRLVRTGDEVQLIRLHDLELGGRRFRSTRIYRVRGSRVPGDWLEYDARVRVRASGRLGTVRGAIETPSGKRYLVLYDLTADDLRPLDGEPKPPVGQDYAEQDLKFLYAVRPGGLLERPPAFARSA